MNALSGLVIGLVISTGAALADDTNSPWSVRVWQSDDGLPNNNVTSLAQTRDGCLWIANPGRLARFDGRQFEDFSSRSLVPALNERITALAVGRNGRLWLGMDHGSIVCLDGGTARAFTNGLPDRYTESVIEDTNGAAWALYRGGAVSRIQDGAVKLFGASDLPSGYGCSLAEDNRGRLWFGKSGQIGLVRDGEFQVCFPLDRLPTRLAAASRGGIWICAGSRLFYCAEPGRVTDCGAFLPGHADVAPTALLEDRHGCVWIGTSESGLFRYNGSGFESIPISHIEVSALLEDQEGNLWAGTAGGGLDRVSRRTVTLQGTENGLPFDVVQSICQDTSGNLWATTESGSLVRNSNGRWTTVSAGPDWPGGRAECVAAANSGAVWIATSGHALLCWRNGGFQKSEFVNGLPGHAIHALLADQSGAIWIAEESPDIVQCLHAGKLATFSMPDGIRIIRAMAGDAQGNIWIGSSKGFLVRVTNGQVIDETARIMGVPMSIRCMLAAPDGTLWIGFAGWGLGRLKDGRFSRISTDQGLYDYNISQIVPDNHGSLWFGADRGIFRVRRSELDAVEADRSTRVQCVHFGRDEGIPSLQANFGFSPGAIRSADGRLWMPMRLALAVVDPDNLDATTAEPLVRIERVAVDGADVALYGGVIPVRNRMDLADAGTALRLPPRLHRLEFAFTAPSFRSPENVRFRYRLAGLDDHWTDAGTERAAAYSRLPAGRYRFEVAGCNSDGVWSQTGSSVAFVVNPFFWQTWWFRLSAVAVAVCVARYAWFRRLRLRLQAAQQQASVERERSRIARDLHDDLGARLTRIVLLCGLARRDRSNPEKAGEHVEKLSSLSRQVIKSLDETVWAVNPRNDTLPHLIDYLGQFAVEFLEPAGITCRPELPEQPPERVVPSRTRHNLFLATKEALNNIVRHSGAREVRLRITADAYSLNVAIEDDGLGFDSAPLNGSADGLRNMRQRLEEIGGEFRVETRPGAGTRLLFGCTWRNGT
jgi:signal transduction histidine kinase/ligand-binding sensor domain-containing protein